MLKQLSRLEKTRNTILLLFVVLMAISLVIFYAPSRNTEATANLSRSQETAATVGSETVTVGEVATAQENMMRQYAQFGSQFTPPVKNILDGEIASRLVRIEATRLNLNASDEEVAASIREQLKAGGVDVNNRETYRRIVTENFGGVEKFEQSVRDDIAREKLNAFLTSGVSVSEEEVVNDWKKSNTSFDLIYVPVTSEGVMAKIEPSEEDLRAYFEKNKSTYYISTPQKKIRYLYISQSKVGEKLEIPDADLKAEYDALPADKREQGVQAQQIVLKFTPDKNEAEVLQKANEIVADARKDNGKISEEAFGNLARNRSEDARTAQSGGKLPGLVAPDPNNPNSDDPLKKILTLEEGQVTEPIKFGSSFYIVRRGAVVPKTFEDAKQGLLISMRNRRAFRAASELTDKVAARLNEVQDVRKVAEEFAAQANMKPDEMVRETGFVKPGDDVPNVGVSEDFEKGIAGLESAGQVGGKIQIKDGFAIPTLVEKKEPRDAEFAEVRNQVVNSVKLEQAKARMEQIANEIAAAASPEALKAAAEKYGLKAADSKDYKVGAPLGEAGASASGEEVDEAIYAIKAGEVTKKPLKSGENYFVVGATKRTEANMDEFAKQRDQLMQSAVSLKKNQFFSDYLTNLRQRMEKEGRIKINKDAIAKLDGRKATDIPS